MDQPPPPLPRGIHRFGTLAEAAAAMPFPLFVPALSDPAWTLRVSFHMEHPHVVPQTILSYRDAAGHEALGMIEEPTGAVPPSGDEYAHSDAAGLFVSGPVERPHLRRVVGETQVRLHSDTLDLDRLVDLARSLARLEES